jgi:hypothetical protein
MRFHRQECLWDRNHRRAGADPGFDLCGSSHRSHPKTADLKGRFAHRWLRASHLAQLDYPAEGVVNCSSSTEGLVDVGVEENKVCARAAALRVLAAHASLEQLTEIVFRARLVVHLILGCFHKLSFLSRSGFGRLRSGFVHHAPCEQPSAGVPATAIALARGLSHGPSRSPDSEFRIPDPDSKAHGPDSKPQLRVTNMSPEFRIPNPGPELRIPKTAAYGELRR